MSAHPKNIQAKNEEDSDIDCSAHNSGDETVSDHIEVTPYVKREEPEDEIPPSSGKTARVMKKPFPRPLIEFRTDHPLMAKNPHHPRENGGDDAHHPLVTHTRDRPPRHTPFRREESNFTDEERQARLFKTKMCKEIEDGGVCSKGEACRYAHGLGELRCFFGITCNKKNLPSGERCRRLHVDVKKSDTKKEEKLDTFSGKDAKGSHSEDAKKGGDELVVIRVPSGGSLQKSLESIEGLLKARIQFRVEYTK